RHRADASRRHPRGAVHRGEGDSAPHAWRPVRRHPDLPPARYLRHQQEGSRLRAERQHALPPHARRLAGTLSRPRRGYRRPRLAGRGWTTPALRRATRWPMARYLFGRLLVLIPMALLISAIVFWAIRLIPVDPADLVVGPFASAEQRELARQKLGL